MVTECACLHPYRLSKHALGHPDREWQWPHVAGPVMTYLAACGGLCREVADPTQLQFFKIDQVAGLSGSSTEWAQKDIGKWPSARFLIYRKHNPHWTLSVSLPLFETICTHYP